MFTTGNERSNDVVATEQCVTPGSNGFDDARCFMGPQTANERPVAGPKLVVGVAESSRGEPHQHLTRPGLGELYGDDLPFPREWRGGVLIGSASESFRMGHRLRNAGVPTLRSGVWVRLRGRRQVPSRSGIDVRIGLFTSRAQNTRSL
jgi:hypothetical protein